MYVFGVSYHKINGKKAGKRAKKYPFLYYYDNNLDKWHSKRISKFEAFFRKFQKRSVLGIHVHHATGFFSHLLKKNAGSATKV